jgi:hypothetical protein
MTSRIFIEHVVDPFCSYLKNSLRLHVVMAGSVERRDNGILLR